MEDFDGDPATGNKYGPEYYALALMKVFRREPVATAVEGEYEYIALVMTPNEISLREWSGDEVTDLASEAVDSVKGVWYDVTVAWDGAELTVSRGLSGGALTALFTAETTLVNDSTDIGFGVGEKAEYRFDEVRLSSPSLSSEEPSKLTEYVYDALGRRVAVTDYTGAVARTTRYLYAGDRIIEELDGDNNLQASYVYGQYVDEILQMRRDTNEATAGMEDHYYLRDDLYNVLALADAGGNVLERYAYRDYGAPIIANAAGAPHVDSDRSDYRNPFLFNGRQYDETTGFYYYRTRYMEPLMGRFISRDTIGLWGDANNLGNPYTYAGNNPWSRLDPFGEGPYDRFGTDDYFVEAHNTLGYTAIGLAKNAWAGIKSTGAGVYWWLFAGDEAHQEAALRVLAGSVEVLNDPGTAANSAAHSAWAGAKDYGNSLLDTPASSGDSVSQAMLFAGGAAAPYAKLGSLTELGGLANLGKVTNSVAPEVASGNAVSLFRALTPSDFGLKSIADNPALHKIWQDSIRHLANSTRAKNYKAYLNAIEYGTATADDARKAFDSVRGEFIKRVSTSGQNFPGYDFEYIHHWNWPIGDNILDAVNPYQLFPVSEAKHLEVHRAVTVGPNPFSDHLNPIHVLQLKQATDLLK